YSNITDPNLLQKYYSAYFGPFVWPKMIHQIWIGPIKSKIKIARKSCIDLNSANFNMVLWNSKKLEVEFPFEYLQRFPNYVTDVENRLKSTDTLRIYLLYKYGGLYIDADMICLRPFDDLLYSLQYIHSIISSTKK